MSIPYVTLLDCTDFSKTVSPYIPQLYELPQQIFESITNPQGLKDLYLNTNPFVSAVAISIFLSPIFLVVSEINKNYSQVDRLWSLLPTMYNAHYALYAHATGLPTQRMDCLLACSTLWSARLTYNYWRKGGYSIGSEDYRWEIIKKNIGPVPFFILNVVFISFAQSILLFSVSMPTYILLLASKSTGDTLLPLDIGFSQGLVGLIMVSAVADQQQWNYQNAKKEYQKSAKVPENFHQSDLDRGFVSSGLWSYSRHPNFAAEQSVWVCLYLWSCSISQTYYNWSGFGALSYLLLFQGSTWFTELLSSKKYPEYKEYQKRVGMFVPGLGSGSPGNFSDKRTSKVSKPKKQ